MPQKIRKKTIWFSVSRCVRRREARTARVSVKRKRHPPMIRFRGSATRDGIPCIRVVDRQKKSSIVRMAEDETASVVGWFVWVGICI